MRYVLRKIDSPPLYMVKRKVLLFVIATFVLSVIAMLISSATRARKLSDMAAADPEKLGAYVQNIVAAHDYSKSLRLIKEAYAESQADPGNGMAEYICQGVIANLPKDKLIALSLDFLLDQTEVSMRQEGASMVYDTLAVGISLDQATRTRLLDKLKRDLGSLKPNQDAFLLATHEVDVLMLLGDDAGLDTFLTYQEMARTWSVSDHWEADSDASLFEQLAKQYSEKANAPGNNHHPQWERTQAAFYRLAKERRVRGIELEPIHPLANLDQLHKQ